MLKQEDKADYARKLLGLPMSRRERLQLTNKERARNERRARAKKRRIELEEDTAEPTKTAKPKGGIAIAPHTKHSLGCIKLTIKLKTQWMQELAASQSNLQAQRPGSDDR